ncbi:choline/carnitine O-acyltransferase [Sporosarcina pasteurii]|uniref:choline/carnitine O-acyltransferase n=1 Tax=Sporosarcina pasteurii TaxID=1474 RepID=UPI002113F67C|nr:choline/carnitine O-acyltransferase [Sporosarcina pasteurii]MDS9470689.1 choline/carnitine O-acyltransferase [Sporosarcina pasteurii]
MPPLTSTHTKLLEWIKPLVDEKQFNNTANALQHFFERNGDAEKLQEKLYQLKNNTEGSWLTPFWEDKYLKYRGSLPTGMHFNILVDRPRLKKAPTTAELAGKVSFSVAEYYHKIIDGEVKPVTIKGVPLDMGQYKKFFRSVRIPKVNRDQFRVASFDKRNNFVIIIYKNHMYQVNVTNENGEIYQSKMITEAIENIFQTEQQEGMNVGLFTTAERDEAAQIYNDLKISKVNADNLQAIADSLIVISIDEDSDNSQEAIENLMLNSQSKYYDKTIQLVITKKGRIGYSIEHTAVDGTTIFAVISYVNEGFAEETEEIIYTDEKPTSTKLDWEVSEEIEQSLRKLAEKSKQRKNEYHVKTATFEEFGADKIKRMRLSPDAFFHMALQIAQYRTFGTLKSVYEPVSIRHFKEGRTECARATSMEKWALVQALENKDHHDNELYALMRTASDAHSNRIHDCRTGFGVERHMFGLEQVYLQYGENLGVKELPAIFKDEGYKTLREDFLSTSGMAYDNVKSRIFGPVVQGGFGIAYILLDHSISINISCRTAEKEQAAKLKQHIIDALKELKQIAGK